MRFRRCAAQTRQHQAGRLHSGLIAGRKRRQISPDIGGGFRRVGQTGAAGSRGTRRHWASRGGPLAGPADGEQRSGLPRFPFAFQGARRCPERLGVFRRLPSTRLRPAPTPVPICPCPAGAAPPSARGLLAARVSSRGRAGGAGGGRGGRRDFVLTQRPQEDVFLGLPQLRDLPLQPIRSVFCFTARAASSRSASAFLPALTASSRSLSARTDACRASSRSRRR